MSKLYKRVVGVVLSFCMIISCGSTVFAAEKLNNEIETTDITLELISSKELASQSKTRASDTYVYVSGHDNFIPYAQTEFSQTMGCAPTAVANLLSFFQIARGVKLFDGEVITQSIYNQICNDVKWSTDGANMTDTANGLRTFCERAGKTCVVEQYLLNLWSDVTRDVNANLPILCNDITQKHFMIILGYAFVNNEKYVYVCTGLSEPLFGYLKWGTDTLRMRSVNIY